MNNPWHHFRQPTSSTFESASTRQERWLMSCLQINKNTLYGAHHGFSTINSVADFQRQVPIVEYETLAPWIEQMANGGEGVLCGEPLVAFEKTGGSHSGGKLIPYTARGLADFRHELIGWLSALIAQFQLNEGKVYWALSPAAAESQMTPSGILIGAGDALYLGEENLAAFAQLSAVPMSLGSVKDMGHWQLLTLYFLIRCYDLRLISVWSPSFLTSLLTALHEKQYELVELLAHGGNVAGHQLCADNSALHRYHAYLHQKNTYILWPRLNVISCWADASSQPLANAVQHQFPGVYLQPKGLLSTEAIITVPDGSDRARLCLDSNFYEFLRADGTIFLAHEIVVNDEYSVIVTTNSGLYRYSTGDRVKCIGAQPGKITLRFLGRDGVCSDLVGEKLNEPFVTRCLSQLKGFATLVPDRKRLGYVLLLDEQHRGHNVPLLPEVERQLCQNPQYAYARNLLQIHPLRPIFAHQPVERYLHWQYGKGKSPGDIKLPVLLTDDGWHEIFHIQE
ncbi:GH3 family domain-containing protein [Dryocola sp. BD626]|uniref:GH3 family domain-containing protein n=1 Tax=Dryocola sp. BD626 TaxID=3133273 RepID=UPI003F4F6D1E